MSSATQITQWFHRAQIDYRGYYMSLYASFNAWYRAVTGYSNDREALNLLRQGNPLWKEYCQGAAMNELHQYMKLLVEFTQREPISYATPHWRGEIDHVQDWTSLVEFWYRVRCLVMHGDEIDAQYVYLAYETLNIFMQYTIQRKLY